MFDGLHAGLQLRCRFTGDDLHAPLQNAGPSVEFLRYEVHRATVPLFARIQHTLVRIESRICGQQRRMYVEYPAAVALHETGAQDAHEAGKDQQVGLPSIEFLGDGAIKTVATGKMTVLNTGGRYARISRTNEAERIGIV